MYEFVAVICLLNPINQPGCGLIMGPEETEKACEYRQATFDNLFDGDAFVNKLNEDGFTYISHRDWCREKEIDGVKL